jgi:phage FluMu protein Com
VRINSAYDLDDAKKEYNKAVEYLIQGKPSKAIPLLEKALIINPALEEASSALEEARNGLKWSSPKFCPKCIKLLTPKSGYPYLKYENFCPRCGHLQNFDKEILISTVEFFTKLIFIGVYIIALLIFCAMPNLQLTLTGIWYLWNTLVEGVFLAVSFTPIFTIFLILINDPWGSSLASINLDYFRPLRSNAPVYLGISILLLMITVYLYFFFMLTPFLAVHRKRMWLTAAHQKKVSIYTLILCGSIVLVRVANGIFY